jgi:sulfur transfer complex TusBCD TusB component (DsrH family)
MRFKGRRVVVIALFLIIISVILISDGLYRFRQSLIICTGITEASTGCFNLDGDFVTRELTKTLGVNE